MLELDTRALLLDALRPPAGHHLDVAVGTTFTLDLTALLAVPLAAALRDGASDDTTEDHTRDRTEALDLFETVRRLADRTVVFAQAGMTSVPVRYRPLYACIENSVVPVRRPRPGRIFHPKLWALRFRGAGGGTHHRVVVLTRNLTFDRSWDVMVTADEQVDADEVFDTGGLIAALRALPRLVTGHADRLSRLDDLVGTLADARLPLPPRAHAGAFVPLGWDGTSAWPFDERCRDALVVSPFLTARAGERFLRSASHGATAVSRPPAFDAAAAALPSRAATLVPLPETESHDDLGATTLQGLHAKLYVQDHRGERYSLWVGSANLTEAAFDGNTELLVRIDGYRDRYGTAAVLGTERTDRTLGLRDLLTEYQPVDGPDTGTEAELDPLQALGIDVAAAGVRLTIEPSADAETWDVALRLGYEGPPVELDARLLTLPEPLPVRDGSARWTGLATASITPYVVLRLTDGEHRHEVLVRAELLGDPPHRRDAVLASCMSSPEDFLRYVLALLGEDDAVATDDGADSWVPTAMGAWLDPERILESLLLAASRAPKRLEQLDRLVVELERTERGRAVVPDDFRAVWEPVRAAAWGST